MWEIAGGRENFARSSVQALALIMSFYGNRQGVLAPKAMKVVGAAEKEDEIYGK